VTRLNGAAFALNPDLVERAESTPDTVITLVDGTKYVIAEPLSEFVELIRTYRALLIARAQGIVSHPSFGGDRPEADIVAAGSGANVLPLRRKGNN
jgi:flagellar protein FlbD